MAGTAAGRAKYKIGDDSGAKYIPTPEEIQRAAAEVRATWTMQRRLQAEGKKPVIRIKRLEVIHPRRGNTVYLLREL